jgi:hypothetical protein
MKSLKRFIYNIIYPENANSQECDLCYICEHKISAQLQKSIAILTCKHFFHYECIEDYQIAGRVVRCPVCDLESSYKSPQQSSSQRSVIADILQDDLRITSGKKEADSYKDDNSNKSEKQQEVALEIEAEKQLISPRVQKLIQGIIQELTTPFDSIKTYTNDDLESELQGSIIPESSGSVISAEIITPLPLNETSPAQVLAQLYRDAIKAEEAASLGNQKEILCWYKYGEAHENRVNEIISSEKITDRTARSWVYDEVMKHLPGIKRENLRKKTQRACKIYLMFKEVGTEKIAQIKSYTANTIATLTINQIQTILDYSL